MKSETELAKGITARPLNSTGYMKMPQGIWRSGWVVREWAEAERERWRQEQDHLINGTQSITTKQMFDDTIGLINATGAGNYTMTLGKDFSRSRLTFATNARKTITIKGDTQVRRITNTGDSELFLPCRRILPWCWEVTSSWMSVAKSGGW